MNVRVPLAIVATTVAWALSAGSALALPEEEDLKGGQPTPLEQAREESSVRDSPSPGKWRSSSRRRAAAD